MSGGLTEGWSNRGRAIGMVIAPWFAQGRSEARALTGLSLAVSILYLAAHHTDFRRGGADCRLRAPGRCRAYCGGQTTLWVSRRGDPVVPLRYFYPVLNRPKFPGHPEVRFTNHEDLGHFTGCGHKVRTCTPGLRQSCA
jgi:hypothetical protein